jgi:hypothetical protein
VFVARSTEIRLAIAQRQLLAKIPQFHSNSYIYTCCGARVRFWHKENIQLSAGNIRFWG